MDRERGSLVEALSSVHGIRDEILKGEASKHLQRARILEEQCLDESLNNNALSAGKAVPSILSLANKAQTSDAYKKPLEMLASNDEQVRRRALNVLAHASLKPVDRGQSKQGQIAVTGAPKLISTGQPTKLDLQAKSERSSRPNSTQKNETGITRNKQNSTPSSSKTTSPCVTEESHTPPTLAPGSAPIHPIKQFNVSSKYDNSTDGGNLDSRNIEEGPSTSNSYTKLMPDQTSSSLHDSIPLSSSVDYTQTTVSSPSAQQTDYSSSMSSSSSNSHPANPRTNLSSSACTDIWWGNRHPTILQDELSHDTPPSVPTDSFQQRTPMSSIPYHSQTMFAPTGLSNLGLRSAPIFSESRAPFLPDLPASLLPSHPDRLAVPSSTSNNVPTNMTRTDVPFSIYAALTDPYAAPLPGALLPRPEMDWERVDRLGEDAVSPSSNTQTTSTTPPRNIGINHSQPFTSQYPPLITTSSITNPLGQPILLHSNGVDLPANRGNHHSSPSFLSFDSAHTTNPLQGQESEQSKPQLASTCSSSSSSEQLTAPVGSAATHSSASKSEEKKVPSVPPPKVVEDMFSQQEEWIPSGVKILVAEYLQSVASVCLHLSCCCHLCTNPLCILPICILSNFYQRITVPYSSFSSFSCSVWCINRTIAVLIIRCKYHVATTHRAGVRAHTHST